MVLVWFTWTCSVWMAPDGKEEMIHLCGSGQNGTSCVLDCKPAGGNFSACFSKISLVIMDSPSVGESLSCSISIMQDCGGFHPLPPTGCWRLIYPQKAGCLLVCHSERRYAPPLPKTLWCTCDRRQTDVGTFALIILIFKPCRNEPVIPYYPD